MNIWLLKYKLGSLIKRIEILVNFVLLHKRSKFKRVSLPNYFLRISCYLYPFIISYFSLLSQPFKLTFFFNYFLNFCFMIGNFRLWCLKNSKIQFGESGISVADCVVLELQVRTFLKNEQKCYKTNKTFLTKMYFARIFG